MAEVSQVISYYRLINKYTYLADQQFMQSYSQLNSIRVFYLFKIHDILPWLVIIDVSVATSTPPD